MIPDNPTTRSAQHLYPAELRSSRGTASADVYATPELTDTPRHFVAVGRGTDKGGNSYPPMDTEGAKPSLNQHKIDKALRRGSREEHHPPLDNVGSKKPQNQLRYSARPTVNTFPALPQSARSDAIIYDSFQLKHRGITSPVASSSGNASNRVERNSPSRRYAAPEKKSSTSSRHLNPTRARIPSSQQLNISSPQDMSNETSANTPFAIQWNINGYLNNLSDLEILLRHQQPIILAIQETHRVSVNRLNLSLQRRYKWTLKCNDNIYHSTAIGVLSTIPYSTLQLNTDLPLVGVRLEYPFPLTVISGYLPNGRIEDLKLRLTNALQGLQSPVLILWDVNGHHPEWGSRSPNDRGLLIMEVAETLDLVVLNDGATTFTRGQQESTVDVSLCSPNIVNRLLWTASGDPMGSDHHPVFIHINGKPESISRRPRWKYNQADWYHFQELVDSEISNIAPNNIEGFLSTIHQAALSSVPRTTPNPGRRSLPWWSPDIKKLVKKRRKGLRAAKRLPKGHPAKSQLVEAYHSTRNECRQKIREAKRRTFEEFLDGINESQTASELWNRANALSGKRRATGMTLRLSEGLTRDPLKIANALADHFASLSSLDQYGTSFIRKNQASVDSVANLVVPEENAPLLINSPFRVEELNFALRHCKGKSAGPDDLGYPLFQHLTTDSKVTFLSLLNKIWVENTIPESWTHSLVVPIPKQGKAVKSPADFRPISLTCCASKILERMVNRRLSRFLEDNQLLDHRQHAFRPGHGTGTYFAGLGDVLQDAMNKGLHADIASLDLSKAYNRAWTPRAIQQLAEWGLRGHILHFLKNFLTGRTFQVIIGNTHSTIRAEETGVPQGSVVAVTIFLVLMNSIFDALPKEIYIFVYADDIVLVVIGRTLKFIRRKLQAAVPAVSRWATLTGFSLSAEKSVVSHICSSRHRVLRTPVTANGTPIPTRTTIAVLGVQLDRQLRFEAHMNGIKKNCQTRLNILRTLSKPHKCSNRGTLIRIAKAIINSRLFYGIELFCLAGDALITRLAPTYNQAIRIIAGLLPSTPADAACVELGTLPFRYQTTETLCSRTISFLEKTSGDNEVSLLIEGNRALVSLAHLELPPVEQVHWVGARKWDAPNFRVDLSIAKCFRAGDNSVAMRAHVTKLLSTKYQNYHHRFTDGSKATGRTGFGVSDIDSGYFYRLPDQCSVFSAEAAAILLATTKPASKPICVISDSASVLATLNSPSTRHPWIQAIQKEAPANTAFLWVPGHCGIRGNVEADHLAAIGRSGRSFTKLTPGMDLKCWVKSQIRSTWDQEWINSRDLFIRKIKDVTSGWNDVTDRHDQLILSRLRSGHTRVTHNMGHERPFRKICSTCNVTMTVEHLIINCPCYQAIRDRHNISYSIRDALANDQTSEAAVISFIKDAGLYLKI